MSVMIHSKYTELAMHFNILVFPQNFRKTLKINVASSDFSETWYFPYDYLGSAF